MDMALFLLTSILFYDTINIHMHICRTVSVYLIWRCLMKKRAFTAVLALIFALLLLPSTATAAITGDAWFYDVPGGHFENLHFEFDPVTTPDGETVYIVEFELTTEDNGEGVPVPSRPGYIFLGWESETDGKIYNYGDTITLTAGSYNFYAVWANMPEIEPTQPDTPDEPDISYDDVSADAWYYDAVEYVSKNGIMSGMGESVFQPDTTMNRAMIWTILARLDGVGAEGGAAWYSAAQQWATENGISDGTDPMGDITREQLAAILYRYELYRGRDVSAGAYEGAAAYPDYAEVSGYAVTAMEWAVSSGLINGADGLLAPQAGATRAQAATLLMRFLER